MLVQTYLFFEGRTEEALEFYKKTLGAEVTMLMRNKEAPEQPPPGMLPPGSENKVMHSAFKIGDRILMASDGMCAGKSNFGGFSLSLSVKTEAEADRIFTALGEGGQVQMPMDKTFFAPKFGIVVDKFGVSWMVLVDA